MSKAYPSKKVRRFVRKLNMLLQLQRIKQRMLKQEQSRTFFKQSTSLQSVRRSRLGRKTFEINVDPRVLWKILFASIIRRLVSKQHLNKTPRSCLVPSMRRRLAVVFIHPSLRRLLIARREQTRRYATDRDPNLRHRNQTSYARILIRIRVTLDLSRVRGCYMARKNYSKDDEINSDK